MDQNYIISKNKEFITDFFVTLFMGLSISEAGNIVQKDLVDNSKTFVQSISSNIIFWIFLIIYFTIAIRWALGGYFHLKFLEEETYIWIIDLIIISGEYFLIFLLPILSLIDRKGFFIVLLIILSADILWLLVDRILNEFLFKKEIKDAPFIWVKINVVTFVIVILLLLIQPNFVNNLFEMVIILLLFVIFSIIDLYMTLNLYFKDKSEN